MKKYTKEFGGLGLQRGEIGKTRMAIAAQLADYYEEHLTDETDPMSELDLPGGEAGEVPIENEPTLDNADKAKLRQLESIVKSMDPETQQVASQMIGMLVGMAETDLYEDKDKSE